HAALIRPPDHHNFAELAPNRSGCRDLINRGVHAVSVSLWFRVASKRSGNDGSRRVAGGAGSLDVLVEAAARGLIPLRLPRRAQCRLRGTASQRLRTRTVIDAVNQTHTLPHPVCMAGIR